MNKFSNFDYIYAAFLFVFGIVMIFNPRLVMRKVKYDEEGMKTEKWVKKAGIGLCVFAVALAGFFYYKLNNA